MRSVLTVMAMEARKRMSPRIKALPSRRYGHSTGRLTRLSVLGCGICSCGMISGAAVVIVLVYSYAFDFPFQRD